MLGIKTLEDLYEGAAGLLSGLRQPTNTWEQKTATIIFGKETTTCLSQLRLIPTSKYYSVSSETPVWDLSSTASLTRNIIETYLLFFYLAAEPCSADERHFRTLLWRFHDFSDRLKVMNLALPPSQNEPDPREDWDQCREQLDECPRFQALANPLKIKIFGGHFFKLISNVQIAGRAGLSDRYYHSAMRYCSYFADSSPYSISQMDTYQSGTSEGDRMFKYLTYLTAGFMALGLRDYLHLFPEKENLLPDAARRAMGFWETVLKSEKLPWFEDTAAELEPDQETELTL